MAAKEFAEYKYGNEINYRKGLLIFIAVVLFIIISIVAISTSPVLFALLIIPVIIIVINRKSSSINFILIGVRYLIICTDVVYYKNINKVELDKNSETLKLFTDQGKSYEIKSSLFPTNARKPEKIKINKTAKFNKTVEKIYARLKEISPGSIK
jgi:hypothetical protein